MDTEFYNVKITEKLISKVPELKEADKNEIKPLEEIFSQIESSREHNVGSKKWFFLNGAQLRREDPTGNIYTPEVNFTPCYVKYSNKIQNLVAKAIEVDPNIEKKYPRPNWKLNNNKNFR